jgi:hypothetical protein
MSSEATNDKKKHPCPDCTFCQWCGDDRCALCLRQNCRREKKLSLEEQIARYEALNRRDGADDGHE